MTPASHRIARSRQVALLLGLIVAALGVSVFIGWGLDVAMLKSIFPGLVTMKANTAAGMLLCGSALALLSRERAGKPIRLTTMVIAVVVIALGTLTLCEYLSSWELGIDQLFFHDVADPTGASQPGRMSPATAFCFLLTGGSLLVATGQPAMRLRRPILAALGLSVMVVSGFALVGYSMDAFFGLRWWNYTGMAVHTAAGFLLMGCGLLALISSEGGLMWSLDALTVGGVAVGIVSLATAGGISYHFTNQLQQSAAWVSHTQEVLKEIEGVSAGVAAIGSSERNYINTGNERLLDPEGGIKDTIQQHLDTLRKLTADNPHQKPRLDQLEPLIDERINWGEQTVVARRQEGLSAAEQIIAAGQGIALSDKIRQVIKEMEDEEYTLLDERQKKEQAISSTTFLLLPLGVFISVTMLSLGLFFLNAGVAERAQAEEKAGWLASFPERNPNPIVELDPASGVIHYVNPSATQQFPNLQREGMTHPLLAGLKEIQGALLDGRTDTARREIPAEKFFFSQTITYIPETRRLRVYSTDITERKEAEEAQSRLAAIVNSSDDAIIGKTLEGIITSWNPGAEKLFGYTKAEAVGQPMLMIFPPERINEEPEILGRIKRGESVDHFETVRVRKDGKLIDVSATISPLKDGGGKIIGASKIARDITERKQAQEALRQQAALFDQTYDAMIVWNWNGPIIFWNRGAELLYGFSRVEALGRTTHELLRTRFPEGLDSLTRALEQKKQWEGELEHTMRDGRKITIETRMTLVREPGRSYVVEANRDITERKRAQEKINQLNAELEQRVIQRTAELEAANKELEAFSYSVSHDLRAPLRAVNGFAGIVLEDFGSQLPEEGKRYLERIRNGGERMGVLIDDLLAFSRLSRQLVNPQPVNTMKLVQSILDELKPQMDGRQLEIKTGELPVCHGDPALLKQAWVNLISNAVKYTRGREPGTIEIGCIRENGENVYFVRDNGAGFDMQYVNKLFGVFQRLHRADEFEGTGVGLAIVQRIIHRHSGRVWAQAAVDRGATFYFTLEGKDNL
jgi:PAS domain S-box-containing protein